jgi:hypothetical protein
MGKWFSLRRNAFPDSGGKSPGVVTGEEACQERSSHDTYSGLQ